MKKIIFITALVLIIAFATSINAKDFTFHYYNILLDTGNLTADYVWGNLDASNVTSGTLATARLDTATPADGDTDSVSTADQIYDWVIGLGYITDGNTGWDNSYGFFDDIDNFTDSLTDGKICIYNATNDTIQCDYTDQTGSGGNTTEEIQDAVGGGFGEGLQYDDAGDAFTFNCTEVTDSANDHLTCSGLNLVVSDDWWDSLSDMALTDGSIYIGNGSNDPQERTMSGDATITNTGVVSVVNTQGLDANNITNLVSSATCLGANNVTQNVSITTSGLSVDCVDVGSGTNYWQDDGDYLSPDPTYGTSVNGSNVQAYGGHLFLRYSDAVQANVTIDASGNIDWW